MYGSRVGCIGVGLDVWEQGGVYGSRFWVYGSRLGCM